jgi:hypothetical protein
MRWYLNPVNLARTGGNIKRILSGGGPRSVRLTGIGDPRGIILPRVPISLEIVGRDGSRTAFEPELPVGLPAGYGFRIARWLQLPVIRDFDFRSARAEFRIPGS